VGVLGKALEMIYGTTQLGKMGILLGFMGKIV
jgi:hypothetical protein